MNWKSARQQVWRSRRRNALNQLKLAAGCCDCGYDAHPAALQFDHRDPTEKTRSVAYLGLMRSWSVFYEELAKCDVRCANCHVIRTAEENHAGLGRRQGRRTVCFRGHPLDEVNTYVNPITEERQCRTCKEAAA